MRFALLLALLLFASPLWAQTAVQRALEASRSVTAHDHATSEQAEEAVKEEGREGGNAGFEIPVPDQSGRESGAVPGNTGENGQK